VPCVTGMRILTLEPHMPITFEDADGPFCRRDETLKDAEHVIGLLENLSKQDLAAGIERLRKDNPNLPGVVIAGMDTDQDGELTFKEFLGLDYLALARAIKGDLSFPKEWDAGQAGKDEKADQILDKFVEQLEKYLKLGIANEDAPPPPQDQLPPPT